MIGFSYTKRGLRKTSRLESRRQLNKWKKQWAKRRTQKRRETWQFLP